jgi:NitT/TauT family transport system substrate-binding protein
MQAISEHSWRRLALLGGVALLLAPLALIPVGCGNKSDSKVKVAYIGLTCEAPIFVAYEKGLFKEEGLEVEFVKTDWDGLRQGLGLGRFDAIQTLIMYVLKPMEQGLDAKITGGVHTGCLRLQVAANSKIQSPKELKGKKIGVSTHLESPPHLFASRVLKALENGSVDAIAVSDPIGTILVGKNVVRTIADQAVDAPYADEYCCVVVVSGRLARDNPKAAAKITRAMMKASKWVQQNPTAAAKLAVDNNYTATSVDINAQALAKLHYTPGIRKCQTSIGIAAKEMQQVGLLSEQTDPEQLTKAAWLDLDGVTDEWINALRVPRVPGGGPPPRLGVLEFALVCEGQKFSGGCCGGNGP